MTSVESLVLFLGFGITTQVAGAFFPLAKETKEKDRLWDGLGAIFTAIFLIAIGAFIYFCVTRPVIGIIDRDVGFLRNWRQTLLSIPTVALVIIYLLCHDFIGYWIHRLSHSRQCWGFHAWHHSSKVVYWISGLRGSPLHFFIQALPTAFVDSVAFPVPELPAAVAVIGVCSQHLSHANIRLPFARQIEWIFVTPRYHRVHHCANQIYTDSNYGFIFSIWDRIFLTYTNPDVVPEDEPKGLDYEFSKVRALFGLPSRLNSDIR